MKNTVWYIACIVFFMIHFIGLYLSGIKADEDITKISTRQKIGMIMYSLSIFGFFYFALFVYD